MGEKQHVKGETTAKNEEEMTVKKELIALRGEVDQLATSRLMDKWALENQLEDMTEEVGNFDAKMKLQQRTYIAMLQDSLEKQLSEVKTECFRVSSCREMRE